MYGIRIGGNTLKLIARAEAIDASKTMSHVRSEWHFPAT